MIAYITAGDPIAGRTPALVAALERGGADLIELGVPFSDPVADGPVIMRAGDRALRAGTTWPKFSPSRAKSAGRSEIPLLLFTYLNPADPLWPRASRPRCESERHRWLPAHRRQCRGSRGIRAMPCAPRVSIPSFWPHPPAPTTSATRRAIFERFCLSGLAHRRHRRAESLSPPA